MSAMGWIQWMLLALFFCPACSIVRNILKLATPAFDGASADTPTLWRDRSARRVSVGGERVDS